MPNISNCTNTNLFSFSYGIVLIYCLFAIRTLIIRFILILISVQLHEVALRDNAEIVLIMKNVLSHLKKIF